MHNLEVLIPITLFLCIAASIKFIVDARLRRRIAETNPSEELMKAMLQADEHARRTNALKWGLVLTVVGLAFGLIDGLGLDGGDPATFGLLIGAAGVAMLGFHALSRRGG
jgi:hypothetical protein